MFSTSFVLFNYVALFSFETDLAGIWLSFILFWDTFVKKIARGMNDMLDQMRSLVESQIVVTAVLVVLSYGTLKLSKLLLNLSFII